MTRFAQAKRVFLYETPCVAWGIICNFVVRYIEALNVFITPITYISLPPTKKPHLIWGGAHINRKILILVSVGVSLQELILYIGGHLLVRCELHGVCSST